jgi:hypothetical protein
LIEVTCSAADLLPLDAIEEFQGNLKARTKADVEQIITSITKYGFSFPFFVWNGTGHNYCLDGHGRIQALAEMRRRGEDIPLLPVAYIEAADEAEAKQKPEAGPDDDEPPETDEDPAEAEDETE